VWYLIILASRKKSGKIGEGWDANTEVITGNKKPVTP
jgi:hypothetical protein